MDNQCGICQEVCAGENDLHIHIRRAHKMKQKDYYLTVHPRHDLLTGEPIPFKDKDYYFGHDFVSKENMSIWVRRLSSTDQKAYCKDLLAARKERKALLYAPAEVELRTVMSPSVKFYEDTFGDYYTLCEQLGFANKYKTIRIFPQNLVQAPIVTCDSREQKPLDFDYKVAKLDFGDYKLSGPLGHVYFERKSVLDFIGTMSKGFERFSKEVLRANEKNEHLIVIVEATLAKVERFHEWLPFADKIGATSNFAFSRMRKLVQAYPNLQFLFVAGRERAVKVMTRIFQTGQDYKEIDLELAQSKGLL